MPLIGHKIETTSANFGNKVRNNCLLVDKTLMIKEFLESQEVSLIVRPRRFGKTSALSMLQHFLASEVTGQSTKGLFDQLAIAQVDNGRFLKTHQGQYPVIFITFKDTKEPSFASTMNQLRDLIQELYREHEKILNAEKMSPSDKALYQHYLDGSVNDEQLQKALKVLSEFLHKAYGKKAIILIDEYDTPLTHAYQKGFLEPLSEFMRDIFSTALKDNAFLEKGLMTGILRVSKNNMLSGLNNPEVYTLLDNKYSAYFGFTEEEALELIDYTHMKQISVEAIRAYYNGYQIGNTVIYNPWSFMKFLDRQELSPYWVATANDGLLKTHFLQSDNDTKQQLSDLMQGRTIVGEIDINLRYEDLIEKPAALWTLLLFSGYLTAFNKKQEDDLLICQLKIPNLEILAQYKAIFKGWLKENLGGFVRYNAFLKSLLEGDVIQFTRFLRDYLMSSLSFRDVVGENKAENFYHGFMAGLIASIQESHWVSSNRESGLGIYDVLLKPKDSQYSLGIIFEFKHTHKEERMKKYAAEALEQINQLAYATELKQCPHVTHILKIGLAFCDKSVVATYQTEDRLTHENTPVLWSKTYHLDRSLDEEYQ